MKPKTLEDAVIQMITTRTPGVALDVQCFSIMRYFMMDKFQVAFKQMEQWREGSSTRYSPDEILNNLYNELTRRNE